MARRDSTCYNFILDALVCNKYPGILFWTDKDEGIFCLKCLCKSKRGWAPSHSKIFEDYHNLKPRKSNDKRQRFLVAMTASPFIEHLKGRSTKEEKYYILRPKSSVIAIGEDVLMEEASSEEGASNEDGEMETFLSSSRATNGPPTGDSSLEVHVYDLPTENDLGDCPMLDDSEESFLGLLPDLDEIQSLDIDQLLQRVESPVPDIPADYLESLEMGASTSFYNNSNDVTRSSPSCSQPPDFSNEWNLQGEEFSYSYNVIPENGDIPPDYDPVKDLIESMGTPKPAVTAFDPSTVLNAGPNQPGNVQAIPGISGGTLKCQSVKIVRLDDNDAIVRNLCGDDPAKKFYMMYLKRESM